MNRAGTWIHLDLDGARLTSAFIGPAMDLQEFTASVDRPELAAKLHAIAQGLVALPWLVLWA
jgi:threonine aldolase